MINARGRSRIVSIYLYISNFCIWVLKKTLNRLNWIRLILLVVLCVRLILRSMVINIQLTIECKTIRSTTNKKKQYILLVVANWLKTNLLTLNSSKTKYIAFSPSKRTQPDHSYRITLHKCQLHNTQKCACQSIERVPSIKYLGIILDERLSWHLHIDSIISRVRKLVWLFKTLRFVMSSEVLNNVYYALAQSVIIYGIPVWGGATKSKLIELERAQRLIIKVMYFKPYRYATEDLYKLSGLLSVRKLYILNVTLNLHKALPYSKPQQDRRRGGIVVHTSKVRTTLAKRQYVTQASYIYNKINAKIKIYPRLLSECKRLLTEWLKTLSYEDTENILTRIQ